MSLEHGFLLMCDWWPILENLPADCFKELMVALVERQRYGTPMPQFSDLRCELYFRVIEPTIERRLDGQKGGLETKKRGQTPPKTGGVVGAAPVATQASKAKQSTEKQSIAIAERSSEEEDACACEKSKSVASATSSTSPIGSADPSGRKKEIVFLGKGRPKTRWILTWGEK